MREQLTSLELMFLVKELRKEIVGARVEKVYDYGKKLRFILEKNGEKELLIDPGYKLYLTKNPLTSKPTPSNFSMFLRKYLIGRYVQDVVQHSFDRIVEIKFDYLTLVVELFSKEKGNSILIDEEMVIVQPQEIQMWKDRRILQKEKYIYPQSGIDLTRLGYADFQRYAMSSEKDIWSFLSEDLSIGENYADEVCLLAEVRKEAKAAELKDGLVRVYRTLKFMLERNLQPQVVYRGEEAVDFVPFPFKSYSSLRSVPFDTLNQALDTFFAERNHIPKTKKIPEISVPETKEPETIEAKETPEPEEPEKIEEPAHEEATERSNWYEKFRWFKSSTGQLGVVGKDTVSSETLVNEYMEPTDIVLKADVQDSPIALVKTKQPQSMETSQSVKEAGEFLASYSKAWELNLGEARVYWVLAEQVSPDLTIRGRKNYLKRAETRLAIGVNLKDRQILSGPLQSISKTTDYFVTIQPGYTKSQQLAEKIKNQWLLKAREEDKPLIKTAPINEIERLIPSGRGDLVEY